MAVSATGFNANPAFSRVGTQLYNGPSIGAGGMADTRDPEQYEDSDPRKSISAAPSFEEYMKARTPFGAPAAPVPEPAAPAAYVPPPAPAAPAPAPYTPSFSAPAPAPAPAAGGPSIGAGGMADTRDPEQYEDSDPRKSISAAPSFEEYMKNRQ
mmetsp:Transcript_23912/g.34229  ORF Transcript_23912/g.34229 Transcript_23912/m.34229 type:complete len:154 (-) Transcript_23912:119-580(-)|eukprot:CAMPEP_0202453668 /NCGR_PEP_ID=MMETSP1360-20130828/11589_1 /ASSEMBLY_ACC=CAM_ASM_000848 /TAXON_ID=515479 /ORGANISM="Licmophora paradoxa, Strain CCMP2313" /LENGTH=153 /DNA_ID=CAMNT_0049072821 /DNA_START=387 /DNA_END=848 /DNA_ORIENTATION=+